MPRRLITPDWYRRHALIGYLVLFVGMVVALAGAYNGVQSGRDNQQRIARSQCLAAKDTRGPLIQYLESTLALNAKARAAHLLPPSPPALRKLQNESLQNLRTLTKVYKERQALPCPPAP